MISSKFNFQIFNLSNLESTNSYALELLKTKKVKEGSVFRSDFQSNGKGQQGKSWESEQGKNLLFSLVISPGLLIENQFLISQCVALGLKNYLDSLAVGKVEVKWPNDILINRRKVAGILIENTVEGKLISNSIIGIGLNVNQTQFETYERAAISLKQLSLADFNLDLELANLLSFIKSTFREYNIYGKSYIQTHYLESLYGFHQAVLLEDKLGTFKGKIAQVANHGIIQVWRNGKLCSYDLKELKFIA
ncbi:MAG: biotin--[acetyl-CoA-carboxylase] ligase [Bacteroidetes bacterium]|nr:MAG: biotin--[acetyl-CoA-carboxylase] ligase [Bacteroidota bacterium]MBL1144181.1 biotin--[acetyl-CoA-carboxylase] ligase [Bacteroidota bacterium]NOG56977.1 biotin--[acetyl-CoA-carboxylase] ligase [Bacteroidota bacterium]